jgi:hypothetical protein
MAEKHLCFYALQVVKMEADILHLLKFEMGSPTARTFLRYLLFFKRLHVQNSYDVSVTYTYIMNCHIVFETFLILTFGSCPLH